MFLPLHEWARLSSAEDVCRLKECYLLSTEYTRIHCAFRHAKKSDTCWKMLQLGAERLQRLIIPSPGLEVLWWYDDKKQPGLAWGAASFQGLHFQLQSKHSPWWLYVGYLCIQRELYFHQTDRTGSVCSVFRKLLSLSLPLSLESQWLLSLLFAVVKLNSKKCISVMRHCGWRYQELTS